MKITDEQVAEAAARYTQGATLDAIAALYGVSNVTIFRRLRDSGVSRRPRGRPAPSLQGRRCTKCGRSAESGAHFYRSHDGGPNAYRSVCRDCSTSQRVALRAAHRVKG